MHPAPSASLVRALRRRADATALRFLVTGGSVALLFFVLSFAGVRAGLTPFTGTLVASAICFATAYVTQRTWTFRGAHPHGRTLPRYLAVQVACGLMSAVLARLLAKTCGLTPLPMAAIVTVASSGTSYVLSRHWVFAPGPDRRS